MTRVWRGAEMAARGLDRRPRSADVFRRAGTQDFGWRVYLPAHDLSHAEFAQR